MISRGEDGRRECSEENRGSGKGVDNDKFNPSPHRKTERVGMLMCKNVMQRDTKQKEVERTRRQREKGRSLNCIPKAPLDARVAMYGTIDAV